MKHIFSSIFLMLMTLQVFAHKENKVTDSLMSSIYAAENPGAAIAVVKNGAVVFKKAYGIADMASKTAVTTSTHFNICSMTKQFTAYAILQLAEEKKLSLDDKISKYFPGFNADVAGKVTIRHLLTHSSGIIDHYDYVDKKLFHEFWDKDALNAIKGVDSVYFPAGTSYRYSNTAYCLLSLIIEKVSEKSYPGYIRENIFKPLKMNESDVIHPDFKIPERALGYEFDNGTFNISDAGESLFFTTMGDGGIYTSVDDYLKWIRAIQNGKGLNPRLVKDAQSPHVTVDKKRDLSYGYGWFTAGSGDDKIVYHTGSNGGFRTIIFMIPSKKYAVVVFSNRTGIDLEDLVRQVNKVYQMNDKAFVKLESHIS